jgi:hypothetical protein
MKSPPNFNIASKSIKSNRSNRKYTIVLDIENTIVARVDIQSEFELYEIRKTQEYLKRYVEVSVGTAVKVYMIRPYALEFLRALEPFFELIVYTNLYYKEIEPIISALEKILNSPVNEIQNCKPKVNFKYILNKLQFVNLEQINS